MDGLNMSKTKKIQVAAIIVIVGAAAYFGAHLHEPSPVAIGDSAPDFSVPALSSGSVDLNAYRGQVVLVNFWATWCPPCVEETPSLVAFAQKMKASGVVVLGISVDDDSGALQDFVQRNDISYPVGRDPDRALAAHYGTVQFPETYIFDRRGHLAEKIIGSIDWNDQRIQDFVLGLTKAPKP
jgi:cytochrome c biogenesis protein CcmG, thiol:disulfide interchange protein DsbE